MKTIIIMFKPGDLVQVKDGSIINDVDKNSVGIILKKLPSPFYCNNEVRKPSSEEEEEEEKREFIFEVLIKNKVHHFFANRLQPFVAAADASSYHAFKTEPSVCMCVYR